MDGHAFWTYEIASSWLWAYRGMCGNKVKYSKWFQFNFCSHSGFCNIKTQCKLTFRMPNTTAADDNS